MKINNWTSVYIVAIICVLLCGLFMYKRENYTNLQQISELYTKPEIRFIPTQTDCPSGINYLNPMNYAKVNYANNNWYMKNTYNPALTWHTRNPTLVGYKYSYNDMVDILPPL